MVDSVYLYNYIERTLTTERKGGEMTDLLTQEFIECALDAYGDSVVDWPDDFKDMAVLEAMTNGDPVQLNAAMSDFWLDQKALPLYTTGLAQQGEYIEAVEEIKNNIWSALEADFQGELEDYIERQGSEE